MPNRADHIAAGVQTLRQSDPVLAAIIGRVGEFQVKPKRDYYATLVRSIVSQQISTSAAKTILQRVVDHVHPHSIVPESMGQLDLATYRSLGISQQKAAYVIDLTQRVQNGQVNLKTISRKSDTRVIEELTQVKGIGVWTAQMFLIFALGRLDVLPVGDLGIRNAIMRQYGLADLPGPAEIEELATAWRPYATIACWYLWRSLELPTKK